MIDLKMLISSAEENERVGHAFMAAIPGPDRAELALAPSFNAWQIRHDSRNLFLCGLVDSHLKFDSALISSSPLIALSEDLTWARTVSRFYRLGLHLRTNSEMERSDSPISAPDGGPHLRSGVHVICCLLWRRVFNEPSINMSGCKTCF